VISKIQDKGVLSYLTETNIKKTQLFLVKIESIMNESITEMDVTLAVILTQHFIVPINPNLDKKSSPSETKQ